MTMNKLSFLFAATSLALMACGDDKAKPDAPIHHDAPNPDAPSAPPAPPIGAQIDRMGRPAINTALNHVFDLSSATQGSAKDAYNQDSGQGTWPTTYVGEFAKNLGIFDALDMGWYCVAGACVGSASFQGCGNQVLYNGSPGGGGSASATSYATLATVLSDDQLYLDTAKGECRFFLAVEFGYVTTLGNTTCGGRAPSYDVVDYVYTAVSTGISGYTTDGNYTPAIGDGVSKHTDTDDANFPFLGAPHTP
jgi:hypothetical protein